MIYFKRALYDELAAHSRRRLPEEACGLIAGTVNERGEKTVLRVFFLENIDHSPTHFSVDPTEHLQAVLDIRQAGLVPLGSWHSHPDAPARMSPEDIRLAYDPHALYMILSLAEEPPVLRVFSVAAGTAREEELVWVK